MSGKSISSKKSQRKEKNQKNTGLEKEYLEGKARVKTKWLKPERTFGSTDLLRYALDQDNL